MAAYAGIAENISRIRHHHLRGIEWLVGHRCGRERTWRVSAGDRGGLDARRRRAHRDMVLDTLLNMLRSLQVHRLSRVILQLTSGLCQ